MGPGSRSLRSLVRDDENYSRDASRPSFAKKLPALIKRAQGRPGARCTRGLVCG